MITLSLQRNSIGDDLTRLVDKIANPGSGQRRMISDGIRRSFQENFTSQSSGNGSWAALAPSTVLNRQKQGYAGSRPILVRSGDLRSSWVGEGGDHYSSVRRQGGYTIFEEGSESPLARFHELGTTRMPARPVGLLGDRGEARIMDVIDFMITQIEREALGR